MYLVITSVGVRILPNAIYPPSPLLNFTQHSLCHIWSDNIASGKAWERSSKSEHHLWWVSGVTVGADLRRIGEGGMVWNFPKIIRFDGSNLECDGG